MDLERSIASDSALVYLGSRTPALASEVRRMLNILHHNGAQMVNIVNSFLIFHREATERTCTLPDEARKRAFLQRDPL